MGVDVARFGRRDVRVSREAEQHHGDAEIADRHRGDWPMPIASPWMKPKNVRIAPASANAAALSNWRSMMNTVIAPKMMPASVGAAAERRQARDTSTPTCAELVEADRGGVGAGGAERVVDHASCPRPRSAAIIARMIAGAWRFGVSWNACEPISMPM